MRKLISVFSIALLLISMFIQQPVKAATEQYDDIAHGEYSITAKALHADEDKASGAARFIGEDAILTVSEDGAELTLTMNDNDFAKISGLQVEKISPVKDGKQWTYKLDSIQQILDAQVQYVVPTMNIDHDVPLRFKLEGLDKLPKKESEQEPKQPDPDNDNNDETIEGDTGEETDTTPPDEENQENEQPEEDNTDGNKDGEGTNKDEEGNKEEEEVPSEDSNAALDKGYYTMSSTYLHASEDKPSSMGRYLSDEVFVEVKEDAVKLTIEVNDHDTVTKLQVNGKDPIVSKLDGTKRYETFSIDSLEDINANVEYQAPFNGSIHKGKASFRIAVDVDNAASAQATDQAGHDISAEYIHLRDGLYAIDTSFINAKNGNASAMARYLGEKAYIEVTDGAAKVYFLVKDNETVTDLIVNDQETTQKINNGKETLLSFKQASLLTEMKGYAEYQAPFGGSIHYGKAEFDIALDKTSINEVETLPIEAKEPEEKTEEPAEGAEDPAEETENPEQEVPAEKKSTIDYVIKHDTQDEVSAADNFFEKPGTLLKKDGKNYLQVTVTNWSMIDWLKVAGKSVAVISEDKTADTAVIQFAVPSDLNKVVKLSMKVTVPGLYETEHDARLVMDSSSLKEDTSGKKFAIHDSLGSGSSSDDGSETSTDDQLTAGNTPDRPSFGSNDMGAASDSKTDGNINPQTGDTSKIIFYSLLLLGSLLVLVLRYRRHQLNA